VLAAELGQHHLLERARACVLLQAEDAGEDVPLGDDVADAQCRRDRLGERADEDHALAAGQRMDRRRPLAGPHQVRIALVLEDHGLVFAGERDQLLAALHRHDRAGRILHRRDGVDVLGRDALGLEVGERRLQRIHAHAVIVERDADDVDAELRQPGQRAAVGLLLDQDGVALAEQQRVHQVEALQRTGGDQDFVG
jgi:hypothetical protein